MDSFERNLERFREVRLAMAERLERMERAVAPGAATAALTLPEVAASLGEAAATLRQGIFRLMFLGDMKRGKSTLLNALLGEDLLPARVTPCTAIITVLRYGEPPA